MTFPSSARLAVLVLGLLCPGTPGFAQARAADQMGSLPLPGGAVGLARAVGIDQPLPRARLVREVIRLSYASPEDPQKNPRTLKLVEYLSLITEYETRLAQATRDGTLSLALAANKDTRKRLEDVLDVAGISLEEKKRVYRVALDTGRNAQARCARLEAAGLDAAAMVKALNANQSFPARLPADDVPSALPQSAWQVALDRSVPTRALLPTILMERAAALLHYGLLALDGPTRAFLAQDPDLPGRLYRDRPSTFAAFSRSLRVRDGRVVVPGGKKVEPLWQALVDEPVTDPNAFLRRLLSKDDGHLAYFFDTLAHLDAPVLDFALRPDERSAETVPQWFRDLYAAFRAPLGSFAPEQRPFNRVPFDVTALLLGLRFDAKGGLTGPRWYGLWRQVFASADVPDDPARKLRHLNEDGDVGAVDVLGLLAVPIFSERRLRMTTFLFAQRAFPQPSKADAPHLLVALRAYARYPLLVLTLQRMGVTDPAIYSAAVGHASSVSAIGDEERRARALAEFQGALGVLERIRFARTIDAGVASALVDSLVRLPLTEDGEYVGHIARWCQSELVPALARATGRDAASTGSEQFVLEALAGRTAARFASVVNVTWEEQPYRVDVAASELARMDAIRRKQPRNGLDATLRFSNIAATLATGITTLETLKNEVAALQQAARDLRQPERIGLQVKSRLPDPKTVVARAARDYAKIKKAKDLKKVPGISLPLVEMGDTMMAEVLASLVYLPNLGDPEAAGLLSGNIAARHDFWGVAKGDERLQHPWQLKEEITQTKPGSYVSGSLLGLDATLAHLVFRRAASDHPPAPPVLFENDRRGFAESVALASPFDFTDTDRDRIVAALARGRAEMAAMMAEPGRLAPLAAKGRVDEWRVEAIAWSVQNEPQQVPRMVSRLELLWIGSARSATDGSLDAWGTSGVKWPGILGLGFPAPQEWETFIGLPATGGLASRQLDLTLLVAEALAEHRLPAVLARHVLAVAMQDLVDEVRPIHGDDWLGVARYVDDIPPGRLDDYIASLTTNGPLVPEKLSREPIQQR